MRHDRIRLATAAGLLTVATVWAAPAQADPAPIDPAFLAQLGAAGVNVNDPAAATALGQSVCPMLTGPAGTAAAATSGVTGAGGGMDPEMAQTFTEIAVQAYCPQMLTQLTHGQVPDLSQIPGLGSFIPGIPLG